MEELFFAATLPAGNLIRQSHENVGSKSLALLQLVVHGVVMIPVWIIRQKNDRVGRKAPPDAFTVFSASLKRIFLTDVLILNVITAASRPQTVFHSASGRRIAARVAIPASKSRWDGTGWITVLVQDIWFPFSDTRRSQRAWTITQLGSESNQMNFQNFVCSPLNISSLMIHLKEGFMSKNTK